MIHASCLRAIHNQIYIFDSSVFATALGLVRAKKQRLI